ncbi:chorismate synthase [Patescibacteria group bacterium]|nr:chorismate synthase [Patescibacteria group bacterium]
MPGNTFGSLFKLTTWGESHGEALGLVLDGCPPNIHLTEKDIQKEVDKRRPAENSRITTGRREEDQVQILSGVFEGKTTGTPIAIQFANKDTRSQDYSNTKDIYRPGHADYTYDLKYGIRDYRGGGRSSGRETVCRVAGGAIAKKYLKQHSKTQFIGHTVKIGAIEAKKFDKSTIDKNELKCADPSVAKKMQKYVEKIRTKADSIGAIIEIIIKNPPKGLGEPVFDKLDARLATAMMSIGAVKGVEIGAGFHVAEMKGSENNDQMQSKNKFLSNNSGGILGGISTGEDIVLRLAIKPVPSIALKQKTINTKGKNAIIQTHGRHDCCLAPRIIAVAEAMAALTIMDFYLIQRGTS